MTELLFGAAIAVQAVLHFLTMRKASEERQRLVNACLARNPAEFVALERASKQPKIKKADAAPVQPIGL